MRLSGRNQKGKPDGFPSYVTIFNRANLAEDAFDREEEHDR